jgi:hypothetical protein
MLISEINQFHAAESILRSRKSLSYSTNSLPFMEATDSLLSSQKVSYTEKASGQTNVMVNLYNFIC